MRLCVGVKGGIADDTGTTLDMEKGTTLDMGKGTPLVPKPVGPLGFLSDYE